MRSMTIGYSSIYSQLYQVAEGLAYLRQEMVVHGDLSAVRNLKDLFATAHTSCAA